MRRLGCLTLLLPRGEIRREHSRPSFTITDEGHVMSTDHLDFAVNGPGPFASRAALELNRRTDVHVPSRRWTVHVERSHIAASTVIGGHTVYYVRWPREGAEDLYDDGFYIVDPLAKAWVAIA